MQFKRAVTAVGVVVAGVALNAAPAFAHVTVDPSSAPKGGEVVLTFRVPNEEDNASTAKVQITFPSDHPVLGIDPEPVPGWTDSITTAALNPPVTTDDGTINSYVSEVDWTGGSVAVGNFQEFRVLAQTLPSDTDSITFKALQTYSNGDVVRWIDPIVAGQPDPDHPAPVLTLTAASGDGGTMPAAAISTAGLAKNSAAREALTFGIIGVVLGVLALLGSLVALMRKRN